MNTRVPRHDMPPNHRRMSVRKRRSTDLLELYVFGREWEATVVERNLELTNVGGRVPGARGRLASGPGPGAMTRRRGSASRFGDNSPAHGCAWRDCTQQQALRMRFLRETRGCAGRRLGGARARIRTRTGRAGRHRRQGPFAHAAAGRASGALSTPAGHRMGTRCTSGTRLIARSG